MKFVIRDDDLNYFSTPEMVERWYGDLFKDNIPVGFAVVPFVFPMKKKLFGGQESKELKEYAIRENAKLVEYLKNHSHIQILQHGYSHETVEESFEYGRRVNQNELMSKTIKGKRELEETFDTSINIFVPPHDVISNSGILAIENARLNVIRGTGSKNFLPRVQYLKNVSIMIGHRLWFPNKQKMPAYPYVLDFGKHKEAYSNRLRGDNLSEMLRRLDYTYKKRGNFIVTTHIHHFTPRKKENLKVLIGRAKKMGFSFVKPSNIFENE